MTERGGAIKAIVPFSTPRKLLGIAESFALIAVIVGALGIAAHSTLVAFRDMYVFPFADMASIQFDYFRLSTLRFLILPSNEHLPFLANPLILMDNLLF